MKVEIGKNVLSDSSEVLKYLKEDVKISGEIVDIAGGDAKNEARKTISSFRNMSPAETLCIINAAIASGRVSYQTFLIIEKISE